MLGEEIKSVNGDIKDAVGEITNMVSGAARKELETLGLNITAAIPTVVAGRTTPSVTCSGDPASSSPSKRLTAPSSSTSASAQ